MRAFYCMLGGLLLFPIKLDAQDFHNRIDLELKRGEFQLDWSIAGNESGTNPNILSELKWNDLTFYGFSFSMRRKLKSFPFEYQYSKYSILRGQGTDTDYLDDDRTNPFMTLDFLSNKGSINTHQVSLVRSHKLHEHLHFVYKLALNYRAEKLYILSNFAEHEGLNSCYSTRWSGASGTLGLAFARGRYSVDLQYHFGLLRYGAKANWNLIEDFQHPISFKHQAKGYKKELDSTITYRLFPNIGWTFSMHRTLMWGRRGSDTVFKESGKIERTQLHAVNSNTTQIGTGITYLF